MSCERFFRNSKGTVISRYFVDSNAKKHGLETEYCHSSPNKIYRTTEWKHGKRHGLEIVRYQNGAILSKYIFKKDKVIERWSYTDQGELTYYHKDDYDRYHIIDIDYGHNIRIESNTYCEKNKIIKLTKRYNYDNLIYLSKRVNEFIVEHREWDPLGYEKYPNDNLVDRYLKLYPNTLHGLYKNSEYHLGSYKYINMYSNNILVNEYKQNFYDQDYRYTHISYDTSNKITNKVIKYIKNNKLYSEYIYSTHKNLYINNVLVSREDININKKD